MVLLGTKLPMLLQPANLLCLILDFAIRFAEQWYLDKSFSMCIELKQIEIWLSVFILNGC